MRRPYVIVGGFMSLDGKTAPRDRRGLVFTPFMGPDLHRRLHEIRARVDAVLVGIGTVLADNPRLTVRLAEGKNPLRIILDSKARIPLEASVLRVAEAPTILAVSQSAAEDKLQALRKMDVEVVRHGQDEVDLRALLEDLYNRGVRRLLVEGGSEVRWGFLKEKLVDELFVWIMPSVWGGREAPTFVDGEGFTHPENAVRLKLKRMSLEGEILVLEYYIESASDVGPVQH